MGEDTGKVTKQQKLTPTLKDIPPPASAAGLMNRHQICQALGGLSLRKFATMRSTGEFPAPDFHLGRNPRWSVPMFNAWVEANRIKAGE